MKIILDASAACELILRRAKAEDIDVAIRSADEVLVPELFVAEIANTFWKYVKARELDLKVSQRCVAAALALSDRFVPMADIIHEAYVTSCNTAHPVYDAIYLVLARRNGAYLLTLDRKLVALARGNGVSCIDL